MWENASRFVSHYQRNVTQSSRGATGAGDIEVLPKRLNFTVKEYPRIPEKTLVDKILGHFRRTDESSGRNHAIGAVDIVKSQLMDHAGGMTADIRSAHPLYSTKQDMTDDNWNDHIQALVPKCIEAGRLPFLPVPEKYGRIPAIPKGFATLADRAHASIAITRPNTAKTRLMKRRLATRQLLAVRTPANIPHPAFYTNEQNFLRSQLVKQASGHSLDQALERHPLQWSVFSDSLLRQQPWQTQRNSYDQERLPSQGVTVQSGMSPSDHRLMATIGRTGRFISDVVDDLPPLKQNRMTALTQEIKDQSLGRVHSGGSSGNWATNLPSRKWVDDSEIDYTV